MQIASSARATIGEASPRTTANEFVFEMRYKPNARILDNRGDWVEALADDMDMPEWSVVDNRFDLFSRDKTRRGFVSFRNAGFVVQDSPTKDYFADQTGKLVRKLFAFAAFGNAVGIDRIGVRQRYATPFSGTFEELASRFSSRYVAITEKARRAIGEDAVLVDVGAPLNFRDRLGSFNTQAGPMREEEFARFFTKDAPFPEVGLFFDIDYFKEPRTVLSAKDVIGSVSAFARAGSERHERIRDLVLG